MSQIRRIALLLALALLPTTLHASTMYTIQYNGVTRQYLLYLPSCYADVALPLVVGLHGNNANSTGAGFETQSGFSNVAEQQCFIAAYPYALKGVWDNNADVGFVQAVVADIESRFVINTDRLFVVGHSGGARLAGHIGCTWNAVLAFAQVSYSLIQKDEIDCQTAPAKPVLWMHGTADTQNAYDNGASAIFWASKYGTGSPFVSSFNLTLDNGQTQIGQLSAWSYPVKSYVLTGGGHPFPSSHPQAARSSNGGPTVTVIGNETVDPAANVIWTFFRSL